MPTTIIIALAVLAFALGVVSDYLSATYTRAVSTFEASAPASPERKRARDRASYAGVAIWLVGSLGLFGVVEVGWWMLVPEGVGYYIGTRLALR